MKKQKKNNKTYLRVELVKERKEQLEQLANLVDVTPAKLLEPVIEHFIENNLPLMNRWKKELDEIKGKMTSNIKTEVKHG